MIKRWISAVVAALAFVPHSISYAQLSIDKRYQGKDWQKLPWSEKVKFEDTFFQDWENAARKDLSNDGIDPKISIGTADFVHLAWQSKDYYVSPVNYQSAAQTKKNKTSLGTKSIRELIVPGGGVCALFIYNPQLERVAKISADLPESNHQTWCNGIYGIGASKQPEGILLSISYYLTSSNPAKTASEIGQGWRYMTVLFRLEKENGQLRLVQDDHCLGNPNPYADIPSARKALAKCNK